MADSSVYSLEIETAAFDRFKKEFDDYHAKLGDSAKMWKEVSKAINDTRGALKGVNDAMRNNAANDNRSRSPRQSPQDIAPPTWAKNLNESVKAAGSEMRKISTTLLRQVGGTGTQSIVGGIEGILGGMSRSTIVTAVVSMAAAAVSAPLFAAFAVAPEMANLRRQALGLGGLNTGTLRGQNVAGAWMDNPQQALGNVVAAQRNFTGSQFQAFSNLFGLRGAQAEMNKDPIKAQYDFLNKATQVLSGIPKNLQDAFIDTYGMTDVFSKATIRAWQAMGGAERKDMQGLAEDTAKRTTMSDADAAKWTQFYARLTAAGEILDSAVIKRLTPLIGPLGEMSLKFAQWVDDSKLLDTALAEIIKQLNEASTTIKTIVDSFKTATTFLDAHIAHLKEGDVSAADAAKGAYRDPKTGKGIFLDPPKADNKWNPFGWGWKPDGAAPPAYGGPEAAADASHPAKKKGSWLPSWLHKSAYSGDDYHQYIQQAGFVDDAKKAYGAYGRITGDPPASGIGAAAGMYKYGGLVGQYGGAALGAGAALAPGMLEPRSPDQMKGAIANDDAERAKFWAFLHWLSGSTKDQVDELKKINETLDKANVPSAAGQNVSFGGQAGAGAQSVGGFAIPGTGGGGGGDSGGGGGGWTGTGAPPMLRARGRGAGVGGSAPGSFDGGGGGGGAAMKFSGDRADFIKKVWPLAQKVSEQTGVDPRIVVAQAGLESNWGKSAPGNNYFGIKGSGGSHMTQEFEGGRMVTKMQSFAGYGSMEQSFQGYADFLKKNSRYKKMLGAQGADAQIAALGASGYATDPNYASKIRSIVGGLPSGGPGEAVASAAGGAGGSGTAGSAGAMMDREGKPPDAFVLHHTAGRGTPAGVVDWWRKQGKGIGAQYIMDRQGVVHDVAKEFGYTGTGQILPAYGGVGKGLSNRNTLGMEIIAKNDADLSPEEKAAVAPWFRKNFPNTPVFGHGQLNPGHREASEGMTAVRAIEADRAEVHRMAGAGAAPSSAKAQVARGVTGHGGGVGPQASIQEPLGLHQWQLSPRSKVELHDRTGSNVHVTASTMV